MIEKYIIYFTRYLYIRVSFREDQQFDELHICVVWEQRAEECEFSYPANDDQTEIEFWASRSITALGGKEFL